MNRLTRRGIFFDLDGTLADSNGVMRRVFGNFASTVGREASDADYASFSGPPASVMIAVVKRQWALPQKLDELIRVYNTLSDAAFLDVPVAAGAAETLEGAFRHGWKVGVVTSNAVARCRTWLARRGLANFVDVVVGGDEVCLGKPQPEPYLIALARSGCARELSIAVEDSLAGAKSALAAGLRIFGYAPAGREPVEWPETVRLIDALDQLLPELTRSRTRRVAGMR